MERTESGRPETRARRRARWRGNDGFTILEALVALSILAVGLLSLAGVLSASLSRMGDAPTDVILRQKAAEAIESVYTARDTRTRTWAQIRNVAGGTGSDGGVFLDGFRTVSDPGADGLVNTADDGAVQAVVQPGLDGRLGTADDIRIPLSNYEIEIELRDISLTLRRLTVNVRVRTGNGLRNYSVTTLISSWA